MYTKEMLKRQLEEMGIARTDTLLVHSSMKKIGEVEGGADTVLDALMEYLEEGLLLLPAHTWQQMKEPGQVYDPESEPCCVGILPELFRKRPGVRRSLHPTHSVAAWGKQAEAYIAGEENAKTPCPPWGVYGRLAPAKGKILLAGVNHVKNTFIHSVEEAFAVPDRIAEEATPFVIAMPDGSRKTVQMHRHFCSRTAHVSESYQKLSDAFFRLGAARRCVFGSAESILCDAEKTGEVVSRVLRRRKSSLVEMEKIPEEFYLPAR